MPDAPAGRGPARSRRARTSAPNAVVARAPRAITISSLLSRGPFRGGEGARGVTGRVAWPVVVESVQGPGSDFAEEPLFRCEAATLATEPFLECPARARCSAGERDGVGDEVPPDDVAEPPLQRADRFAWRLAFGELAVVVAAAGAVAVADLGDRGDVQGVVESPVAASRQPVGDAAAGGELDRRRPRVGGEACRGGEPGRVPVEPISMAATIGPIPKISVSVVADAATAVLIRRLESRSWLSRRSISATSSTAWRCRSTAATSSG